MSDERDRKWHSASALEAKRKGRIRFRAGFIWAVGFTVGWIPAHFYKWHQFILIVPLIEIALEWKPLQYPKP